MPKYLRYCLFHSHSLLPVHNQQRGYLYFCGIYHNIMLKEKNQRISTLLAFALLPLSGFATDIYIPSLPSMGADMHISAIQVQLTLTVFLITYGTSQLFIGSILDSFGRYRMSLIALF